MHFTDTTSLAVAAPPHLALLQQLPPVSSLASMLFSLIFGGRGILSQTILQPEANVGRILVQTGRQIPLRHHAPSVGSNRGLAC